MSENRDVPVIFLSYYHKETFSIAENLDQYFGNRDDVDFRWDEKSIHRGQSIPDFMESARNADIFLALVSPNYPYSLSCMYEFSNSIEGEKRKEIFSVVFNKSIYDQKNTYINFWKNENKNAEATLDNSDDDYVRIQKVAASINEIMKVIVKHKNLNLRETIKDIDRIIFERWTLPHLLPNLLSLPEDEGALLRYAYQHSRKGIWVPGINSIAPILCRKRYLENTYKTQRLNDEEPMCYLYRIPQKIYSFIKARYSELEEIWNVYPELHELDKYQGMEVPLVSGEIRLRQDPWTPSPREGKFIFGRSTLPPGAIIGTVHEE